MIDLLFVSPSYRTLDPSNGEVICAFAEGTAKDVDIAVEAAEAGALATQKGQTVLSGLPR